MSSDREIVITRVFDAPRELVFETFTDPKHVPFWWGPKGFTTKVHEMDVWPGGVWRLTMRGPDGTEYKNRIVFKEIAKPERLVYSHQPESWPDSNPIEITVTFEAQGDKTSLTMRMVFPTAPARVEAETRHHALQGISQSLSRLGERMAARGHEVNFHADPRRAS